MITITFLPDLNKRKANFSAGLRNKRLFDMNDAFESSVETFFVIMK